MAENYSGGKLGLREVDQKALGLRQYRDRIEFSRARFEFETPFEVIGWGCLEMVNFFFGPGDPASLREWIEEEGVVLQRILRVVYKGKVNINGRDRFLFSSICGHNIF